MKFQKHYEARDLVQDIIEKDFLGPIEEDEIICDERPLEFYILGKLYPQLTKSESSVECNDSDESYPSENMGDIDTEGSEVISLSNENKPSSLGITFSTKFDTKEVNAKISLAKYILIDRDIAREKLKFEDSYYKKSAKFWKRQIVLDNKIYSINIENLKIGKIETFELDDNLELKVILHREYSDKSKSITLSLINSMIMDEDSFNGTDECLNSFFQPKIIVEAISKNTFCDVRKSIKLKKDPELRELEMLYSKMGDFASGHGCSVDWIVNKNDEVTTLETTYFPSFEVLQMMPTGTFDNAVLSMKFLSESSYKDIFEGLSELIETYDLWINKQSQMLKKMPEYSVEGKCNIDKCTATKSRLKLALNELKKSDNLKAFQLANKAMFLQRKRMLQRMGDFDSDKKIRWYPFQLAFFLQESLSFSLPDSQERKLVDLLWFPTGGGKTEAYLGIAAYAIFLRRLRHSDNGAGVSIIMRYTLRLLSFQQFERASALVCACEYIRRQEGILGGEIGIGLWAGKALTPNNLNDADKILSGEPTYGQEIGNPAQIKKCPWCGEKLTEDNYKVNRAKTKLEIKCSNIECEFTSGLPVYLVDQEIYKYKPTFIIATVDKFAQVALNDDTAALFGIDSKELPPDLIIQDELHLISGPLGTITGLYEAAIIKLCSRNNHIPKIIASTATIRNAKEQIKALYGKEYTQFPPQGIDINDSFFAEVSQRHQKPARKYIGCMAIGTSPTTMMIRGMSSLLFATRYLEELDYEEKVIDSFWTQTAYFNTLRELGGAIVRVVDDIQDRFTYLKNVKFKGKYHLTSKRTRYDKYKELTSREKSENIGEIIQDELTIAYKRDGNENPYDFILASNMISVGVDIGRLGTMVVVGQPKATSEYIQATSRVGRENPGLVLATFNQAKSRDRSHYEQFKQFHQSFYKFVESTSVTPFSDRARDRALQALFVILCRYTIPGLKGNYDAKNFTKEMHGVDDVITYILDYVKVVDKNELLNVKKEINEIAEGWESKAYRRETLLYNDYNKSDKCLFDADYKEESRFRVLNTMRSVENSVNVISKE